MAPSDYKLGDFHAICDVNGIIVHPSIRPKHVPGYGLGVHSTGQIKEGEQLIHVPASQVFTTADIPEDFLDKSTREDIAVHAQLAAFFAFAKKADLEPYRAWMDTWPAFGDFFTTVPIFWGDLILRELEKQRVDGGGDNSEPEKAEPVNQKQKTDENPPNAGSPDSTSAEIPVSANEPLWASGIQSLNTIRGQVIQMAKKLVLHTISIDHALPKLKLLKTHRKLTRFFHAWCIINTRCFYYIPPTPSQVKDKKKPKAPADPNEAMGLCPYMDFFNHTAPSSSIGLSNSNGDSHKRPCQVVSGVNGFTAIATFDIPADTEILFSYGLHTNDTLWSEYGFMLPDPINTSDSILLDSGILDDLSDEQRSVLDNHGFLGEYTLYNEGSVCYKTEMAAWLPILGTQKWMRAVEEGLEPADVAEAGMQIAREDEDGQARLTRSRSVTSAKRQHCRIIEGWLKAVQEEAERDKIKLIRMDEIELTELFKSLSILEGIPHMSEEEKSSLLVSRCTMCRDRCEQIRAMTARGVEAISADAAGEL